MKTLKKTSAIFVLTLGLLTGQTNSPSFFSQVSAEEANKVLTIGIFPRRDAKATVKLFKPMMDYLEKHLNRRIRFGTSKNYEMFWRGVESKTYDLVHYNPYDYMVSHKKYGYEVILRNKEFGEDSVKAAIVIRKDSGINTVEDLRGKTIALSSKRAMISHIAAVYALMEKGLKPNEYKTLIVKNPPSAVFSVFHGKADAGGAGNVVSSLPIVTKQIDASQLTHLVEGEPLAHVTWAVKEGMPEPLKQQLKTLLMDLSKTPEGMGILKNAKVNALVEARNQDYDPHRRIVKAVLGEEY